MSITLRRGTIDVREPLSIISGTPLRRTFPDTVVRPALISDLPACEALHLEIHGYARTGELKGAIERKTATVAERNGKISGYATLIGFFGHAIGQTNDDLKALIAAAPEFAGPGFLLPSRNGALFRWCLEQGLRVVQPMTLMSTGLYSKPAGKFLPSIIC